MQGHQRIGRVMVAELCSSGNSVLIHKSDPHRSAIYKGKSCFPPFRCAYEYREGVGGYTHGIKPEREVAALPPCIVAVIARLVASAVLPKNVVPDSAIVNVYNSGDCIPPHGALVVLHFVVYCVSRAFILNYFHLKI